MKIAAVALALLSLAGVCQAQVVGAYKPLAMNPVYIAQSPQTRVAAPQLAPLPAQGQIISREIIAPVNYNGRISQPPFRQETLQPLADSPPSLTAPPASIAPYSSAPATVAPYTGASTIAPYVSAPAVSTPIAYTSYQGGACDPCSGNVVAAPTAVPVAPVGVAPTAMAPVLTARPVPADLYVGRGLVGQPTVYVPGQPVRNFFRWITP